MNAIRVKALARKFNNAYLFVPAFQKDKKMLDDFCRKAGNRYIVLNAEIQGPKKTFDQVKTVFALVDAIFESQEGRKPTDTESYALYSYLLRKYGDKVPVPFTENEQEPIRLSAMTKAQAARFIGALASHLARQCNLPEYLVSDVCSLLEAYANHVGILLPDLLDNAQDGTLLTVDQWVKLNNFSHASGKAESLEIAHIISKGTAPQYRDCVWNFLRLTRDEHQFQHSKGWNEFLRVYPHLRPRVERARMKAGKLGKTLADEVSFLGEGK